MDRNPLCRPATAWLMTRLLNVQRQAQAISINQQLLNAHLRNLATQQIAYDGLMLMENLHQLGLAVFLALDLIENPDENPRLEFQCKRLLRRKSHIPKNIVLGNVCSPISCCASHVSSAPQSVCGPGTSVHPLLSDLADQFSCCASQSNAGYRSHRQSSRGRSRDTKPSRRFLSTHTLRDRQIPSRGLPAKLQLIKSETQASPNLFWKTCKNLTGIAFPVNLHEFWAVFLPVHLNRLAQEKIVIKDLL